MSKLFFDCKDGRIIFLTVKMDELQVDSENQLKTSAVRSKWTKQSILKLFTGTYYIMKRN